MHRLLRLMGMATVLSSAVFAEDKKEKSDGTETGISRKLRKVGEKVEGLATKTGEKVKQVAPRVGKKAKEVGEKTGKKIDQVTKSLVQ